MKRKREEWRIQEWKRQTKNEEQAGQTGNGRPVGTIG